MYKVSVESISFARGRKVKGSETEILRGCVLVFDPRNSRSGLQIREYMDFLGGASPSTVDHTI